MKSNFLHRARLSAFAVTLATSILLSFPASAGERRDPGVIIRHSEVKPEPSIESETLAMLEMGSRVGVAELRGPWIHVYLPKNSNGWVQMRNLRLSAMESNGNTSTKNWLRQITGAVSRFRNSAGEQNSSSQTGIRGLTPDDLAAASPDHGELEKLDRFQVSKEKAEHRASDVRLSRRSVAYLSDDTDPDANAASTSRGKD